MSPGPWTMLAAVLAIGCGRSPASTHVPGASERTGDLGVVTLDSTHRGPHMLRLVNQDGSVWWEGDPFADGAVRPPAGEFKPVTWHPDYHTLGLRIHARGGTDIEV